MNQTIPRDKLEALGETYSADVISDGKLRGTFEYEGHRYVCTGLRSCNGLKECQAQRLVPRCLHPGPAWPLNQKPDRVQETFYENVSVRCHGAEFVLVSPQVTFNAPPNLAPLAVQQDFQF